MEKQGSFSIWQDGMKVASGFGPLEDIKKEAAHYAMMYSQDGPVKVSVREIKPKLRKALAELLAAVDWANSALARGDDEQWIHHNLMKAAGKAREALEK